MTIADLHAKLDTAKRTLFSGRLPESLERVGLDYIDIAKHLIENGKPIDGVAACLDMAVKNSLQMEQKPLAFRKKKLLTDR